MYVGNKLILFESYGLTFLNFTHFFVLIVINFAPPIFFILV